jgi:THO complex subunit 4
MSGRLDQSLDSIIDSQKKAKRDARRRSSKAGKPARAAVVAPVGGVKKTTKPVKVGIKGATTGPSAAPRESKIVVSGLVSFQSQT